MSFFNQNYNYPPNYNANGAGWVNPAAFGQSPIVQMPTPESSGYSSANPSISSQSYGYGFAPGVMNAPAAPAYPAAPALPYPTMGFGMPMPGGPSPGGYGAPAMPAMPMPGASYGGGPSFGSDSEDPAQSQELPFQAVSVPIAEGMFSSDKLNV
ncbi:hypothetical protein quinque_007387 [Culex quinquefasciatus]